MTAALRQFLAALLLAIAARADTLEEANALYAGGDYAKAASACEALIESEGATASRLFNLANARYQLKEYGPAILACERAALLAPRDADIRATLKLARDAASVHDEVPPGTWWEQVLHWGSLHEWSWLAISGALLVAAAALVSGFLGLRRAWLNRVVLASLSGGFLLIALSHFVLWARREEGKLAIVTAAKPVLRLSPFPTADEAGSCGTGRAVYPGERVNGWVHVTLRGTTTTGWLRESELAQLMPDA